MSSIAKTVLATGTSSGLGFEVIKQLLQQPQPYNFILGSRNVEKTETDFKNLGYDSSKHSVHVLPLDLLDLRSVQLFSQKALTQLGKNRVDYLFLAAGVLDNAKGPGPHGSKWCAGYMVNHLAQHYFVHLIRETLAASKSRVVFVSSGAIRSVRGQDPNTLDVDLKANSGAGIGTVYSASKFAQLLGAHYWRRNLPECTVVAVSPGLIPDTKLAADMGLSMNMADAKTVPEGAENLLRAFFANNLPADPEQLFLTSWGEWWPTDVYATSLDTNLQNKWCLSREEIEKTECLTG
ncbi:short-chain dehydrogenases/reductase [Penicillium taxi]|uniref:short-chain dehydrogenases/reductase n=1 Tax=Penicillium taxi TaxID=168475 RepID=UPI0025454F6F|nr:short-chain dehydrogenases/reductase [Penicillium taxi]KAJ5907977.1 short-chain dehydrogenases/reductase [Penicillium taxi]